MTDLAVWLLEQINADEREARDAGADAMMGSRWKAYPEAAYNELQTTALTSCRRVLAECAAKRAIIEWVRIEYGPMSDAGDPDGYGGDERWVRDDEPELLRILAQPYRDRPGWRDEWSVET